MSGRSYPPPSRRAPRPLGRGAYPAPQPTPADGAPSAADPGLAGGPIGRHGPRHLADSWEGPVSLNRPLPSRRHGWHWLLFLPIVPAMVVPLYNRMEPRLLGLPFFYWFQLAMVALTIAVFTLVYQLTKGRRPRWPR